MNDLTPPTITFSDNLPGIVNLNTESIEYTLNFSKPITGLTIDDLLYLNAKIIDLSGEGATWKVTMVPDAGVAAHRVGLGVRAGGVSDAFGNVNEFASDVNQYIDTVAPVAPKLETNTSFNFVVNPQITMQTSLGTVVFDLYPEQAPIAVANMLAYVNAGFYADTLFHRVISNFMVQGGGFKSGVENQLEYQYPVYNPIKLESDNGLNNLRGTLAMARSAQADSATSQFFVNHVDNAFLNFSSATSPGYAVLGQVVSGLSVIDAIAQVPTTTVGYQNDVPVDKVVIHSIDQTRAGSSITQAGILTISGLEAGAEWFFSLDSGVTWTAGAGEHLSIPAGYYSENAIQIRQIDVAGNMSTLTGKLNGSLLVDTTAANITSIKYDNIKDAMFNGHWVVSFSEAIARGEGQIKLKDVKGVLIESFDVMNSAQIVISGSNLTLNPTLNLKANSGYYIEFAAGSIKDLAGNVKSSDMSSAHVLLGSTGKNTLIAISAQDNLVGGAGDDTYVVKNKNNKIVEFANQGNDTVKSSIAWQLGKNLENLQLTGTQQIEGVGNELNNKLTGNTSANKLSGLAGNDLLYGLGGADTLLGGSGADTLIGGAGKDVLTGGLGADRFKYVSKADGLDNITDFNKSQGDKLEFVQAAFSNLPLGVLGVSHFLANKSGLAGNADHRFIFETDTRILRYDSDGSGSADAVQIAKLNINNLAASDILITLG